MIQFMWLLGSLLKIQAEEGREALSIGHCCDLAVKMNLPPKRVAVLEV